MTGKIMIKERCVVVIHQIKHLRYIDNDEMIIDQRLNSVSDRETACKYSLRILMPGRWTLSLPLRPHLPGRHGPGARARCRLPAASPPRHARQVPQGRRARPMVAADQEEAVVVARGPASHCHGRELLDPRAGGGDARRSSAPARPECGRPAWPSSAARWPRRGASRRRHARRGVHRLRRGRSMGVRRGRSVGDRRGRPLRRAGHGEALAGAATLAATFIGSGEAGAWASGVAVLCGALATARRWPAPPRSLRRSSAPARLERGHGVQAVPQRGRHLPKDLGRHRGEPQGGRRRAEGERRGVRDEGGAAARPEHVGAQAVQGNSLAGGQGRGHQGICRGVREGGPGGARVGAAAVVVVTVLHDAGEGGALDDFGEVDDDVVLAAAAAALLEHPSNRARCRGDHLR
uniref:Uncharacterized protein n=1 Tax=Oryza sativa subsp. japonica TaxID=39947 RepID=Q75L40_ORYSJ|nr:hypothetical protein [Oryza sativa Japonica Group]